jgi:hypothetical protein
MKKSDPKVLTEFNKEAIFSLNPAPDRNWQTALEDAYSSPISPLDRVSSPKDFTPDEPHSSEETMKRSSKAVPICTSSLLHTFKIILGIGLVGLLLMLTFGPSSGQVTAGIDDRSGETLEPAKAEPTAPTNSDNKEVESVTMSIAVEEGGSIDLKPPPPGMTIETWKGKDVLLIVEKVNTKGEKKKANGAVEPIDIQVTRKGKDVHIETMCGAGWENSGMDVSFRLMIPENRYNPGGIQRHQSTLSELTSKVWKALHKEAIMRLLL